MSAAATAIAAIIYIPKAELSLYLGACLAYCAARGYFVAGTVTDSMEDARRDAQHLGAAVIVVARRDHALPRVEVIAESHDQAPDTSRKEDARRRRPRRI